jgi:biopolymer transport protein ExbD
MLAYTLFVLIRFSRRYHLARRESRALLVDGSWRAFERGQRRLIADLSRGLRTLEAITSAAPFLGLAGTSYGILVALWFGSISASRATAEAIISARIGATPITAAAGILVAIPAILAHNFLRIHIDRFRFKFLSPVPVGMASHEDPTHARQFRLAQTLPLKKRFSSLTPFALIAAPALASVVAVFMAFEPYETPTGLDVRLLPVGSLDGDRLSPKPIVIAIVAGANGSPVIRVNSRQTPPYNLEGATRHELNLVAEPRVYVEAECTVAWADVTNVIDVMEGVNAEVVLLTATPDPSSGYTQRAKPMK